VPDAVIVAEPTELDVVVAHKGVVRWRCHTQGTAAHSSMPERGVNAIYRMAPVLAALEEYAESLKVEAAQHPLLGSRTLSVGLIGGGISVNTVPDRCTIEIDRRLLPAEDEQDAYRQAIERLAEEVGPNGVVHDEPYLSSAGLSHQQNRDLAAALRRVARDHGASGALIGVPYGTDAPAFDEIGAPTVIFGPGSIAQAHTEDEWVDVAQLEAAADIYYDFASQAGSGQLWKHDTA
jgi:acetylornithine deacetylase